MKLGPGAVDRGSLVGEACKRLQRLESDKVGGEQSDGGITCGRLHTGEKFWMEK